MVKTLCELTKLLKADMPAFLQWVVEPTHVCRKCGRVANDKGMLCKPIKIRSALRRDEEK